MADIINLPNSAWHEQRVTLSGRRYTIISKYNIRDDGWYIDIINNQGQGLYGLKMMPQQNITYRYKYRDVVRNGDLWCMRTRNNFEQISRDNVGTDKTYQLWWIPDTEAEELGINDTIQL